MNKYNIENLKREIPYKWKVQNYNKDKTKGNCVAFIDARDAMNLLDRVVGSENWSDSYEVINGNLYCKLSIYDPEKGMWVTKTDCGTESAAEKEKGEASDSFKRAAVKWGIGRFLYTKGFIWVPVKNKSVVDDKGKTVWDVTEHLRPKDKSWKRASFFIDLNDRIDAFNNEEALIPVYQKYFKRNRMINPTDLQYASLDATTLKNFKKEVMEIINV